MVVSTIQGLLRTVVLAARRALGLPSLLRTEDRRILEQVILPEYARRPDIARVLFVGCASYTQTYSEIFRGREYWTIDPVASRRRYGSERHIIDHLQNLGTHVQPGYFDLVVCNGVLGWGLNALDDANIAFAACHTHLRPGGDLLLGWNDVAPRNRVLPQDIPALQRFDAALLGSRQVDRWAIDAPNRHVFNFYRKPLQMSSDST